MESSITGGSLLRSCLLLERWVIKVELEVQEILTTPIYLPAKAGGLAYGEAVSSSTTYMTKNA